MSRDRPRPWAALRVAPLSWPRASAPRERERGGPSTPVHPRTGPLSIGPDRVSTLRRRSRRGGFNEAVVDRPRRRAHLATIRFSNHEELRPALGHSASGHGVDDIAEQPPVASAGQLRSSRIRKKVPRLITERAPTLVDAREAAVVTRGGAGTDTRIHSGPPLRTLGSR
jgi:hypothetical protein